MKYWFLILTLFSCASPPPAEKMANCSQLTEFNPGQICKLSLNEARVTQATIGMVAVWDRVTKIERAYQKGSIKKYRQKRVAPIVVGPGHEFFMTDRHHLSLAIVLSRIPEPEKFLNAVVLIDLSQLDPDEFWKTMQARQWVFLNKHGNSIDLSNLPKRITELEDDPYRSLAYYAAQSHFFDKTEQPFLDFEYANQYRRSLNIPNEQMPKSPSELKKLLTKINR